MHKLEIRGERMTQQRGRSSHSPRSLAASAEHGSATAERADTGWFEGTRRHGWWRVGGEARLIGEADALHFRPLATQRQGQAADRHGGTFRQSQPSCRAARPRVPAKGRYASFDRVYGW